MCENETCYDKEKNRTTKEVESAWKDLKEIFHRSRIPLYVFKSSKYKSKKFHPCQFFVIAENRLKNISVPISIAFNGHLNVPQNVEEMMRGQHVLLPKHVEDKDVVDELSSKILGKKGLIDHYIYDGAF